LISASKTVICASNAVKVSTSSFRITRTLSGSEGLYILDQGDKGFNMGYALRKDVAVFHQVPAKSVDALGALTHQKISGPEDDCIRLLLLGLDRNEAHARSLHSFTDGLGIRRIVLLPLDEWLDIGWRHQSNGMTQLADLSCPVVRAGTGFHRDDAGRLCREKGASPPLSPPMCEGLLSALGFSGDTDQEGPLSICGRPLYARENVRLGVARGRMLSSVRPLTRQEDSRRPVWEFADQVQITRSAAGLT
jgi:hypothetical protein